MSFSALRAARLLRYEKNWRGSINRAYYAAFSAVSAELRKRVREFPHGFEHPPHWQTGLYIKKFFTHMSKADRNELRDAVTRLYAARLDADYRHATSIAEAECRSALVD